MANEGECNHLVHLYSMCNYKFLDIFAYLTNVLFTHDVWQAVLQLQFMCLHCLILVYCVSF